ncbi:MAG TPA: methyltransferase domain-containing protein [Pyrinomonadaceae bacterium]|nr:methyltransferase domain-containing protein [Pyrinomonadaceae bacterium]
MAWEVRLFQNTRLAAYQNCLRFVDAYAEVAPLWERVLLAIFIGLGPPLARPFGGNTKTLWQEADVTLGEMLAASGMSPQEIVQALREYIRLKRKEDHHLSFDKAREMIYEQPFYPLVTHFTLAFQPSAFARMRFVRRAVHSVATKHAVVADIGCGSGAMLCQVLEDHPEWVGHGLDISEAAIDYARRLAAYKGVATRASFQTGCLMDLPFDDRSIDVVIASEVVEHLPEPERVFSELSRVLAPGGLLLLTMPVESHTPAHVHTLNNAEDLCSLIENAGLTVSTMETKWHVAYGDDRKHIFAVAHPSLEVKHATQRVYSLSLSQMSSAANSGMVSS